MSVALAHKVSGGTGEKKNSFEGEKSVGLRVYPCFRETTNEFGNESVNLRYRATEHRKKRYAYRIWRRFDSFVTVHAPHRFRSFRSSNIFLLYDLSYCDRRKNLVRNIATCWICALGSASAFGEFTEINVRFPRVTERILRDERPRIYRCLEGGQRSGWYGSVSSFFSGKLIEKFRPFREAAG